jgi:hypothetical protein
MQGKKQSNAKKQRGKRKKEKIYKLLGEVLSKERKKGYHILL